MKKTWIRICPMSNSDSRLNINYLSYHIYRYTDRQTHTHTPSKTNTHKDRQSQMDEHSLAKMHCLYASLRFSNVISQSFRES